MFLVAVQTWTSADEPTDAALMASILKRDAAALEALYDRYSRPIYSLVLRIAQDPHSTEEIVQDVFLLLWRNAGQYQEARGPLEPWLFTLARNRALDFLRLKREKQRRREIPLDDALSPADIQNPHPERALDRARSAERVRAVLRTLPDLQRRAIELAFFDGMTHTEISAAMGEPLGTVKSWIRGGLLRLRESLGEASA